MAAKPPHPVPPDWPPWEWIQRLRNWAIEADEQAARCLPGKSKFEYQEVAASLRADADAIEAGLEKA